MTFKFASTLVAFTLAVSPCLGQIAEQIMPAGNTDESQPLARPMPSGSADETQPLTDADTGPVPDAGPVSQALPSMFPSLPGYAPFWTERFWFNAGYTASYVQPVHLPALVTTSPAGTPQARAGVLGAPGTNVLVGDRDVDGNMRAGFRFDFGCWFDNDHILGFDAGFFWMTAVDQRFNYSSNGNTILARPYTDAATGAPASLLVAFPTSTGPAGTSSFGSINVSANSGQFYGTHFDFQESLFNDSGFRLKSLLGYRFLHFSDGLSIAQAMEPSGGAPAPPPGTQLYSQDSFAATNTFNGGEIGFQAEWIRGPFAVSLLAKTAIGVLHRDVGINGSTLVTAPGFAPISSNGGLLALSTNSGDYSSNVFTFVPEVGVNFAYDVTSNLRLTAGYSLLVVYDAVRAADQVDTTVNSSLLNSGLGAPTNGAAGRPAFSLQQSNVWVQSVNVGLEFRY